MQEVSVIIPNFNGMAYLDGVLSGLECQTVRNFEVILVDNGSSDGSCAFVASSYPWVHMIELPENFGFCKAVNEGIKASRAPYVLLLNNDIEVTPDFIEEMLAAIRRHKKAFSCAARMIQFHDRDRLDDAGNYYCALGWAYARGKGKDIHTYEKEEKIFASCAGAAIYRRKIFEKIGYFDEEHFAYLEDMDVGYRARINGYENWYAPKAMVYQKQCLSDLQKYAAASDHPEPSVSDRGIWDEAPVLYFEGIWKGISCGDQERISDQQKRQKSSV